MVEKHWRKIHYVPSKSLQDLLAKYDDVFQEGLGTWEGYEATIDVDADATPQFCRPRSVPLCHAGNGWGGVVQEGTLEPVEHAEWAAPIVPVLKPDKKSVRLCGDFRSTVNLVSKPGILSLKLRTCLLPYREVL